MQEAEKKSQAQLQALRAEKQAAAEQLKAAQTDMVTAKQQLHTLSADKQATSQELHTLHGEMQAIKQRLARRQLPSSWLTARLHMKKRGPAGSSSRNSGRLSALQSQRRRNSCSVTWLPCKQCWLSTRLPWLLLLRLLTRK